MTSSPKRATSARARTAHKPLTPFTIDHWLRYSRNLILDNGEPWEPEDFQIAVVEDIFSPTPEIWLVVPEGNGKTTLMGGVGLYYADYTETAAVLLAAASRDQCGVLLGQAAGFIYRTPGLEKRFDYMKGYRRIDALRTRGTIQVYPADERTGDGVIPGGIVLCDEGHRWRDLALYRTWVGKLNKRPGTTAVMISTAGVPGSEFEQVRELVKTTGSVKVDGQHLRAATSNMILHDYAVRPDQNPEDLKIVAAANPFSGVNEKTLKAKRASPSMTPAHWARVTCNLAVAGDESAIGVAEWAACAEPGLEIAEGEDVFLGIDLGWKWDTTAIVPIRGSSELEDAFEVGEPTIIVPPRDGTATREEQILLPIRQMADRWNVRAVVIDPNAGGEQLAQHLEAMGLEVISHSQDNAPMCLAAERLSTAIREGKLKHPDFPALNAHVLNAQAQMVGEKFKFVAPKRRGSKSDRKVIDACVALAMVLSHAIADAGASYDGPLIEVFG